MQNNPCFEIRTQASYNTIFSNLKFCSFKCDLLTLRTNAYVAGAERLFVYYDLGEHVK